ncbi:hypothetical protein HPB52_006744 [Rhipicephalus sanguineus]|uniref:Uncharacterized protein n=1 Tax=Rhipicephalus sanguineus TaxID=34632 RepID=A0A9D4SN49_RHISA|nr:hypothetical protein HPB52_006744 [Rhipicephalus sanguineus]
MQAMKTATVCLSLNIRAVAATQAMCGNTVRRTLLLRSLVQWYPLRLASSPYAEVVLAPPLVSPRKQGALVDPSAVYPCGSYEAYIEAKKRRQHKKKEDESESTDTSSLSGPDERERKQMPRSYFYKGLKLPSGRLVDIRYRNKYIRKWARKEARGDPCQMCCAVFMILLLVTILYVYLSNQVTPKSSTRVPAGQKSAESTVPFTETIEDADEAFTVQG